jgi:hypothetical protein
MLYRKGNQIPVFTHVEAKRLYRFFVFRKYLLSVNTSGLYEVSQIKKCANNSDLSYSTLKDDMKRFQEMELIVIANGFIKINRLEKQVASLWNTFSNHTSLLADSKTPAILFSDLYKERIIKKNVFSQVRMEAAKCSETNGRKLRKLVRHSKQKIGARTGVNLSVGTIGIFFGRTKGTGHRYIERMHATGVIKRFRNNKQLEIPFDQLSQVRKAENLYGRLFTRDGKVYERLMNSYLFLN